MTDKENINDSGRNHQLSSEQQLIASNQQLEANEQQLRAANQQLEAFNQQLASNEKELKNRNHALQERLKEINCLHSVSTIIEKYNTIDEILQHASNVIPPGWQYPEITVCRINYRDTFHTSDNFKETKWKQHVDIAVKENVLGSIEVFYLEEKPILDEGPFLKEERQLIDSFARIIGRAIESILNFEKLQASNNQLIANEQQLRASNQQLEVSEQELKNGKEKYSLLAENAKHFIITHDLNGKITYANKYTLEFLNVTENQIIGKNTTQFMHSEEDMNAMKQRQDDFLNEKETVHHYELKIKLSSGEDRILEVYGNPIKKNKKIKNVLIVAYDITERKQAEEKLNFTKDRLIEAQQYSKLGWWELDINENLITWSDELYHIFGITHDEDPLSVEKVMQLVHPDYHDYHNEQIELLEKTGAADFEYPVKHPDGKITWIWSKGKLKLDKDGNPALMFGVTQDITERKQAEKQLKESESFKETLLNTSPDLIYIYDIVTKKNVYSNESILKILGYSIEEIQLMGENVISELMHPDDLKTYIQDILPRYQKLKDNEFLEHEYRMKHQDGSWFWLRSRESIYLRSENGEAVQIFGIVTDITERKQAEEKLNLTKNRLLVAQKIAGIGSWDYSFEEKCSYWTPELYRIFGLDENHGPIPWPDHKPLIHPEDWERIDRVVNQAFTTGVSYREQFRIVHKNGSIVWAETRGNGQIDEKGNVISLRGTVQNITERKLAEEKLKESEGRFRNLVDTINSGVAIYKVMNEGKSGSDYIIQDFNQFALKHEKVKKEEVVGKSLKDIRPNIDEFGLIDVFRKVWKTGESTYFPAKVYIDENYSNYYENRVFKLPSGEIVAVYDDVTKRERVGLALKESEERLRLILDQSPYPTAVIDMKDDIIHYWSQSATQMFGHAPKTTEEWFKLAYPYNEYRKDVIERWMPFVEDAKRTKKALNTGEYEITCKDGSVKICELYAQFIPGNLVVTLSNITERKQSEEKLKERERMLNEVGEIAKIGGWEMDLEKGGEATWTRATYDIVGVELGEPIPGADEHVSWYLPEYQDMVRKKMQDLVETKLPMQFEAQLISKKGDLKWCLAKGEVVEENGKVVKLRGTFQDITERKKAEEELLENQHYLKKAQEIGIIGTWHIDVEKNTIIWTEENYKIFEVKDGTPINYELFINIVHPDDKAYVNRAWGNAVMGEPYDIEHRLLVDGEIKWVREKAELIFDSKGKVTEAFGVTQDITKRKKAELLLKEKNEEYESINEELREVVRNLEEQREKTEENRKEFQTWIQNTPVCTKKVDLDFNLQFMSEAGIRELKVGDVNEFYGKPYPFYFFPEPMKVTLTEKLKEVKQTEKSITLDGILSDTQGNQMWYNHILVPVKNKHRKLDYILIISTDISGRKEAELELIKAKEKAEENATNLEEYKQRLQISLEATHATVFQDNLITGEMVCTPEMFYHFGYDDDEIPNTMDEFSKLIHPDDLSKVLEALNKHIEDNTTEYYVEYRIKDKKGNWQWIDGKGHLCKRNEEGRPELLIGISRDISNSKSVEIELVKAKEKAEESDNLKSAFLANMSHEIRTPMSGVIGFSERLKKKNLTETQKDRYIEIIQNSSHSLLTLINDIIDISKIEAGQLTMVKEPCMPGKMLQELKETFNLIKKQKNKNHINFALKIPSSHEYIENITDTNRLKQVLSNLLSNALKFTDEGTIEFGFNIVKDKIKFFVRDEGIGIAQKDLNSIFNRFQQASITSDRVQEGTGLGLSISKGIIELLGGEISVRSTLGKGTFFEFSIPYEKTEDEEDPTPEQNEMNMNNFKGKTILIVEDDFINLDLYEETLKETPATVLSAHNGQEAVEMVAKYPNIDIILMDIRMPVMDGNEAAKIILKDNPKMKIIAQTAYAMTNDRQKYLALGFVDHFPKPIDVDELLKLLSKWF